MRVGPHPHALLRASRGGLRPVRGTNRRGLASDFWSAPPRALSASRNGLQPVRGRNRRGLAYDLGRQHPRAL